MNLSVKLKKFDNENELRFTGLEILSSEFYRWNDLPFYCTTEILIPKLRV